MVCSHNRKLLQLLLLRTSTWNSKDHTLYYSSEVASNDAVILQLYSMTTGIMYEKKTITALFHVKTELHTYYTYAHAAVPIIILSMAKVQLTL